jgi:DegV family protein with EDD domain
MRDFVIVTDSTSDVPQHIVEQYGIRVMPLQFTIGGKNYYDYPDQRELPLKDFYQMIREGERSVTGLVNVDAFVNVYTEILESGKDVLYVGFSHELSGTYQSGVVAAEEVREQFPEGKIITVDTLAAAMGEGLLVYYAALKKEAGASLEEVAQWLEENKLHLVHWFTVDDLQHLRRGGRLSATSAIVGGVLNIKPILHIVNEGKLVPFSKARGKKQMMKELVNLTKERCQHPDSQYIFVSHSDAQEDAQVLAGMLQKELPDQKVEISNIGPVIGSHTGCGTLAIFFLGTER